MKNLLCCFTILLFITGRTLFGQVIESLGVFTESGFNSRVTSLKAGININWGTRWFEKENRFLSGHYEASIAKWTYRNHGSTVNVMDYSVTPVFQYNYNFSSSFQVFAEGAIGLNLLSDSFKNLD